MKSFVLALTLLVAACAENRQVTREEYLLVASRTYGLSQERLIRAAEEVLRKSDNEYTISHQPRGLVATKPWTLFLLLAFHEGVTQWKVDTEKTGKGTKIYLDLSSIQTGGATGAIAGTSVYTLPSSTGEAKIFSPAAFNLFFARLDKELGRRADWLSCEDAARKNWEGSFEALCPPKIEGTKRESR